MQKRLSTKNYDISKEFFFVFILCDLFFYSVYIVITQHRPFEVCNASVTYLHENINDESEI